MTTTTTKTAAIALAAKNHSPLFKMGSQWVYSRTDGRNRRESMPREFFAARASRAWSIAEDALILMGHDKETVMCWVYAFEPMSARNIVAAYLVDHPQAA